jgi:hypothetical protein
MPENYKISDEFHALLEKMAATDQVSVVVLASEPEGLEEALAEVSSQRTFDRTKIIYPLYRESLVPITEYCEERDIRYDINIAMRSVFAVPTVEQVRELAKQDYVLGIMENQRVY